MPQFFASQTTKLIKSNRRPVDLYLNKCKSTVPVSTAKGRLPLQYDSRVDSICSGIVLFLSRYRTICQATYIEFPYHYNHQVLRLTNLLSETHWTNIIIYTPDYHISFGGPIPIRHGHDSNWSFYHAHQKHLICPHKGWSCSAPDPLFFCEVNHPHH